MKSTGCQLINQPHSHIQNRENAARFSFLCSRADSPCLGVAGSRQRAPAVAGGNSHARHGRRDHRAGRRQPSWRTGGAVGILVALPGRLSTRTTGRFLFVDGRSQTANDDRLRLACSDLPPQAAKAGIQLRRRVETRARDDGL
jgi:hypothetical protein